MKHITRAYQMLGIASLLMTSVACTDVKSVDIIEPGIERQNSKLYQTYLSDLRSYKSGVHKVAIAQLDNSRAIPTTQAERIGAVPDSLDYLILSTPDNISTLDAEEMQRNREERGIKTLYTIDFDAIKALYDQRAQAFEPSTEGEVYTPSFDNFLRDSVTTALQLSTKHNYDGIVFAYEGKSKLHMTESELSAYTTAEDIFLGLASDWLRQNPTKDFLLQGRPQNIADSPLLEQAKYILIDCQSYSSKSEAKQHLLMAARGQGQKDKLVPVVSTKSLDLADSRTGYWGTGGAIEQASQWIAEQSSDYTLAGLAVYNIGDDYYNPSFTYSTVRGAISIINPSVKK